jgi:hypothetical protein
MKNHHFWFVEKKVVIHLVKFMTKYPWRFDIQYTYFLISLKKIGIL